MEILIGFVCILVGGVIGYACGHQTPEPIRLNLGVLVHKECQYYTEYKKAKYFLHIVSKNFGNVDETVRYQVTKALYDRVVEGKNIACPVLSDFFSLEYHEEPEEHGDN